jgi:hypothetical protein
MNITEMDIVSFISKVQDIINKAMKYDLLQVTEEDIETMQEKARKYDRLVKMSLMACESFGDEKCENCPLENQDDCLSVCDMLYKILDRL